MSKPRCVFIVEWQHARAAQRGFMQLATIGWRRLLFIHPKPRGTSLKAGLPGAIYILGLRPKRRIKRTFLDRTDVNLLLYLKIRRRRQRLLFTLHTRVPFCAISLYLEIIVFR